MEKWKHVVYSDADYTLGWMDGTVYLTAGGRGFRLSGHPFEPCLYITDEKGNLSIVHHSFEPSSILEAFCEGRPVTSVTGRRYSARDFCRMVEYAAGKGEMDMDDAEQVFGGEVNVQPATQRKEYPFITDDPFLTLIQNYPDAVPEFYLLKNAGFPSGLRGHQMALEAASHRLMDADEETEGWNYDLSRAKATRMSPAQMSFRDAFLDPSYGGAYTDEDYARIHAALFPEGTQQLEIYQWSTDWSEYFDEGNACGAALCLSYYDRSRDRFVVILSSAT